MITYKYPILASILAIVITTTMDFTGYTIFSALPLFGLILLFWAIERHSKTDIGLHFGNLSDLGLALSYPLVVLPLALSTAFLFGEINTETTDWNKAGLNILLGSIVGSIMILLTEEGFFRGWLWASFRKHGTDPRNTLIITSFIFTLWHISAVFADSEYGLPIQQIPVYLVNATLLGLIWGLIRMISGSVIMAAVSHAVWNALAYELFGFGEKTGALGIENTPLLGPEVGFLGILLNGLFFFWLWRYAYKRDILS